MEERYPHLLPEERILWKAFLKEHGDDYQGFDYDVHVGKLFPEHRHLTGKDLDQVRSIYRRRIDVVGYQPGVQTIFEVKPHAGTYAFGQIVAYLELYEEEFFPADEIQGALVTYLVSPDVEHLLEKHGVAVFKISR